MVDTTGLPVHLALTPVRGGCTTHKSAMSAYLAELGVCSEESDVSEAPSSVAELLSSTQSEQDLSPTITALVAPLTKPVRRPSKAHLALVASQPCVICKLSPCDAHHLKIAQPRSLGRKVSDEFTVPLCRKHHPELHKHGNEANWWMNMQVAPLPIAKELWEISAVHGASRLLPLDRLPPD